jgi:hypothetical protein
MIESLLVHLPKQTAVKLLGKFRDKFENLEKN